MCAGFDTLSCKYSIAVTDTRPSQGVPDVSRDTCLCKGCKMDPEKKKPISLASATHAKNFTTPKLFFLCQSVR